MVIVMFKLIYIILGFYFVSIIFVALKNLYKQNKNSTTKTNAKVKPAVSKTEIETTTTKDAEELFILNKDNAPLPNDNNILVSVVLSKVQRHITFEKAKYKCEECGNIANLDVYEIDFNNSETPDEYKVLCRKCSKSYASNNQPLTER